VRTALLVLAVLLAVSGCRSKGRASEDDRLPSATHCASDSDCAGGWTCLGGECADPRPGAIVSDPASAVTPDKVRRELEQAGQKHENDIDRSLEVE
jgi:hypothetical protein